MTSSNLSGLSDQIGDLTPVTPTQTARALAAAIRAARTREEAERFKSMLGVGEDK